MKKILFALVIITGIAGCVKEKSATEMLTAGPWYLTAATIDPPQIVNGAVITDWYAQLDACDKDNILYFYSNNTYKFDEGQTKCNAGDPQNTSGTWSIISSNLLRIVQQQDTVTYGMLEVEEERLMLDYQARDTANVLHTVTVTYRH